MRRIRFVQFGVGAIGAEVVRLALEDGRLEPVGAIDLDPEKAGRDLGRVAGLDCDLGIVVREDAAAALRETEAEVVVHSTGSRLDAVYSQLRQALEAGRHVISTCEELAFPWARHPELARALDRQARERGLRVLGAGVNPGFVMDLLPSILSVACQRVEAVRVRRVVDVAQRRLQLQRKVGVGLTPEAFQRGLKEGSIGHVGLLESALMVADALGWRLEQVEEEAAPVLARSFLRAGAWRLEAGQVAGCRQTVRGLVQGREVLRLELVMALRATDPHDAIEIDGVPPIRLRLPGGIEGDSTTAALVVHLAPLVTGDLVPPGLLTVRDLPLAPRTYRET